MARDHYVYKQVEAEVRVTIDDFDHDQILKMADEIREKRDAHHHVTGGPDFGAFTMSFGSWDALKLREAVARGDAYGVLDLVKRALSERRAAA